MRKPSMFSCLSSIDPSTACNYTKRKKLETFLLELSASKLSDKLEKNSRKKGEKEKEEEVERQDASSESALRISRETVHKEEENFQKWVEEEMFVEAIFLLSQMNTNRKINEAFFLEFTKNFFTSDQSKVSVEVGACYKKINTTFESLKRNNANPESKQFNQLNWTETENFKKKMNKLNDEYNSGLALEHPRIRRAHQTLHAVMRQAVYKKHPGLLRKRVALYFLGGFLFVLALALIIYLTVQTLGLIHLLWMVPTAALASTAGLAAVGGGLSMIAATPSARNKLPSIFGCRQKEKAALNHSDSESGIALVV